MVDQFSGFPMVQKLPSISSSAVIRAIAFYFNLFGNPRLIIQDQGKQLTSEEFKNFLKKRGINTILTSAYNPQANGLAESSVKIVKRLYEQCSGNWKEFDEQLLHWRDTPNDCGYSPGDIFFARRLKTSLPILPGKNSLNIDTAIKAAKNRKNIRTKQYQERSSRNLPELSVGDRVFVQDHDGRKRWTKKGVITGKTGPRGYSVKIDDSAADTTRDRKHLRPAPSEPYIIPDDWTQSDLDAIDPLESAMANSENEWTSSDEDSGEEANEPLPENPPPPALRRSNRIANGKKSCQSCTGCKLIHNFLTATDDDEVPEEKLPQTPGCAQANQNPQNSVPPKNWIR